MKIAYLIHDFRRFEGQGRYTVELAARASRQHEVHVFASHIERYPDCNRIRFHEVRAWRANAMTTLVSFALSSRLALGRGFDVVHSQGFCTFGSDFLTAHICNRAWHRALAHSLGGLTRKERIYDKVSGALERSNYRSGRLRRVIAVSHRVGEDLRTHYGCRAPIEVIPHGVDLERFHPDQRNRFRAGMRDALGFDRNEFIFLYVGDLRKGARFCLEALARTPGASLVFVSRSASEAYRTQAAALNVEGRIRFVEATGEIEKYYALADAFVLPTPYDAFAMVVTEAMASGLPVIVSREAGASELIEDGRNGLLLERHNDAVALAVTMNKLAVDRAFARRLGENGRATVEGYSWDAIAEKTFAVYESLRQAGAKASLEVPDCV